MAKKTKRIKPVSVELVENRILEGRGQQVMLDEHLAELYGVSVSALVQAMKRNRDRFPDDFMFQLSKEEWESLKSQNVIANKPGRGGRRSPPYAFTEHGILMLSSVLRSQRAVDVNIQIMRTFVRLRKMLSSHADLSRKLNALEGKYDEQFRVVFDALRQLMAPPSKKKPRRIGFQVRHKEDKK